MWKGQHMKEERRTLQDLYKRAMQKAEYLPFIKKHSDCYSVDHKKTLKNWNMMTLINKFWFLQFDYKCNGNLDFIRD